MIISKKHYYLLRLLLDFFSMSIVFISTIFILNYFLNYGYTSTIACTILASSIVIWYISSKVFNLYNDITLVSYSQETIALIKVSIFHLLLFVFILFLFDFKNIYRGFVIFYCSLAFVVLAIEKYLYRIVNARLIRNNKNVKNIIIVGNKDFSYFLHGSNLSNNNLYLNIVGVANDLGLAQSNFKYLGPIDDLEIIINNNSIDQVLISMSLEESDRIEAIIAICEKIGIEVSILSSPSNQYGAGTMRVTNYASIPVLHFKNYPLDDPENQIFKRIFDIVFSLLIIITIFSWLFPLVAIIIKLTSSGPVFFNQYRWGLNNKKIRCYKFRTMYIGSNEIGVDGTYLAAQKGDNRVTNIGKFLRKTSIDEMPQFVNVFLGSMSVVGPRPHPIPLNLQSKDIVNNYLLRHMVKPGITGWAQVNGSRGEVKEIDDMQNRVNFDIWYIENWTLWMDVQIIFQTVINLIKGDEKAF